MKNAIIDFNSSFEKGHTGFGKGHCKFCLFVKFQKPPKLGGVTMTEGFNREDVMVNRKHGEPPKVGDKSPKVGDPSTRSL